MPTSSPSVWENQAPPSVRPMRPEATASPSTDKVSVPPETVVVLGTGGLGQTKGPVTGPDGQPTLEFRSTWRRDETGRWLVVFDDGACRCAAPPAGG